MDSVVWFLLPCNIYQVTDVKSKYGKIVTSANTHLVLPSSSFHHSGIPSFGSRRMLFVLSVELVSVELGIV